MCWDNGKNVSQCIKLQFINTHLPVEAMNGLRVIVAVIDDIIFAFYLME